MGMYELMEGKMVNGRGVWQMSGGEEYFMYYSIIKQWGIGDKEDIGTGDPSGFVSVATTALTPDQVSEKWRVSDVGKWSDAPKVRARMYSAEEKRAAAEKLLDDELDGALERWSTNGGWSTNRVWDDELDDLVYTHADGRKQIEKPY
jgi:hypothetical protein